MLARASGVLCTLLLLLLVNASAEASSPDPLAPLRELYLRAVEEESAIREGMGEIERLRHAFDTRRDDRMEGVLTAYAGALTTLRAKHGFWPHDRLHHLRNGLRLMDAAVGEHPGIVEIRYLRLMSCFYLPGILGRNGSVRDDFAALVDLLPDARGEYPPEIYRGITRFVLENASLSTEERSTLEAALEGAPP